MSAHRLALKSDIKAMAECRKNIETQARLIGAMPAQSGAGQYSSVNVVLPDVETFERSRQ